MSDETIWRHPDGADAPRWVGISGEFRAEPDENGEFPVPDGVDPDDLRDLGFERVSEEEDTDAPSGDDGDVPLDELDHGGLKARAEALGIADDIDLRSKASIREGIEAHTDGE